jgi:C1A family cysteine protease
MAEQKSLDLGELRVELQRQAATWRSVDTTIAMLDESDRAILLGVPLPSDPAEIERVIETSKAIAPRYGNGTAPSAGNGAGATVGAAAAFDARNVGGSNYVTPIKDQRGCGSCVAFGTLAAVETTAAFRRRQPAMQLDLSEQHLFFVLGPASGASCANGWWPAHAYTACRDTGVTFEDYMPYDAAGGGTLNPDWPNRLATLTGYQDLTGNVAAIKQHIENAGSVSACFIVFQDFFSYGGGVYRHVSGAQAGGHCVSLIGFDDAQGCWIAKNSWGTGWGEQGFFRIGYGECGIETWGVFGADWVHLRMWVDELIRGLWSNEDKDNAWAYVDKVGWAHLAYAAPGANVSMLTELTSSRLRNMPVHAYHDNGQLTETYVF